MYYTKLEEMLVMGNVVNGYVSSLDSSYKEYTKLIQEKSNSLTSDIISDAEKVKDIGIYSGYASDTRAEYLEGKSVVEDINKAVNMYQMAQPMENLTNGVADKQEQEAKRIWHGIKTGNQAYQKIVGNIAYDAWKNGDRQLENLGLDMDGKVEQLEKDYEDKAITKEQFIYYEHMCNALLKNPEYVSYQQQFESKENTNSGNAR